MGDPSSEPETKPHLAYWQLASPPNPNDPPLPYWQINVPPHLRTPECPPYLLNLNAKDLSIVSTPDTQYQHLSWPKLKHLVSTGQIGVFDRKPSDLRAYHKYMFDLKQRHGSVIDFVLKERLGWKFDVEGKDGGEEGKVVLKVEGEKWGKGNVKVLWNDWPYGIDEKVVHLVVWTKFLLDEVPGEDRLVPEVEKEIVDYVEKTFVVQGGMKPENVIWFKNWKSLKSVHAVEHFHVMLFDPNLAFVDKLTDGDEPRSRRAKRAGEF